jgi:hypothetical protein
MCFVDMGSDIIPEDDDERGGLYDDVDHPLPVINLPASSQPIDDEIYEELPGIYLKILGLFLCMCVCVPVGLVIKLTT